MNDIQAIDTMSRPFYIEPERAKPLFEAYEYQVIAETAFGGVRDRLGLDDDEVWKVLSLNGNDSLAETLEEMDEVGVDRMFVDEVLQWSPHESREIAAADLDLLAEWRDKSDGRIVPGVGYNPFRIDESLARIERAVEDLGFNYVWFHPVTFGLEPSDERCYPLYRKCDELDVPVSYQSGHSAEPIPSEYGRPMYIEPVARDFPDLTLILTHAGWPWPMEWCSVLWRYPNVYGNIGAYFPSFLPEQQVEFFDSGRIRNKVLWASNALGLDRCKSEFLELPIREKSKRAILRENALNVFDI